MTAPLPPGPFDLIYADPPWRYDVPPIGGGIRSIEQHYDTMPVADIAALPVGDIAAPDACILLWATNPLLPHALRTMDAWGFEYRTNAVWAKPSIGIGYWFRQQHELLLVGKRGKFGCPAPSDRRSSIFEAKRAAHSKKPATVAEWIEQAFPDARKVELFARYERAGWTCWGNELRQCVMPMVDAVGA